jgi:hypothetical protein
MQTLETIECLLVPSEWLPPSAENPEPIAVASEAAKQFTLQLSIASTQLCKKLNDQVGQHSEFETWKENKSIPQDMLKDLWNSARGEFPYKEIPERFNRSAWLRVQNIYAGWFGKQDKLLSILYKVNRWLSVAKSDLKLVEISGCELEQIQIRADQLLSEAKVRLEERKASREQEIKDKGQKHLSKNKKYSKSVNKQSTPTATQPVNELDEDKKVSFNLTDELFDTYFSFVNTNASCLDQCAIVHLLKNGCKVASELEDPKKFAAIFHKKQKQAQRIDKQLNDRMPKIRDLGEAASKALSDGVQIVTLDNAEFATQLANLQRKSNPLPYSILFYSRDDIEWYLLKRKNPVTQKIEERIFVKFKGLNACLKKNLKNQLEGQLEEDLELFGLKGNDIEWKITRRKNSATQEIKERISIKLKGSNTASQKQLKKQLEKQLEKLELAKYELSKEYVFEVCCHRRQLPKFQVFLRDWQIYTSNKEDYSVASFAFKAAALVWRRSLENGIYTFQPYLKCTLDYRELTSEGAESARAEDVAKLSKKIANYKEDQKDGEELTKQQMADLKRAQSQLKAMDNPYPRPSKPPYRGNPNIIVGVCFSREQVATVAVVDCLTQQVIAYRSIRQLLGNHYEMLSAYRLEQGRNANERHKQQKRGKFGAPSESKKGQYIDRLIARAVLEVAQKFKAESLALPDLTGLRESLQSELEAKAEWKYPGDKAKQKEYEKQHKINLHRWSYGRLIQYLKERAGKVGVPIELRQQPAKGDLREKAVQIALSAYLARKNVGT